MRNHTPEFEHGEMRLSTHAAITPGKSAVIEAATGRRRSYLELDQRSSRLASYLVRAGLGEQSHVAALLGNCIEYFDVAWATQRSGLWLTPVNWHLTGSEAAYIINDCEAEALITTRDLESLAPAKEVPLQAPAVRIIAGAGGDLEEKLNSAARSLVRDGSEGAVMFYSSGTTGRPKGIVREWTPQPYGTLRGGDRLMRRAYQFDSNTVYLCPAPLYHAAPLTWSMGTIRLGGTVVLMDHFNPLETLRFIDEFRVTHVQMVPTMFVRLLKLTAEERRRYDLSSLKMVIHAAAPCPVEVKQQMIEWLGPIIHEYYAASEANGFTMIGPEEWLTHPGSVGRPAWGAVHILDDEGAEMPTGEVGTVWFEGGAGFHYHKDPDKTASSHNAHGWTTLGDLGHLDPEGYLYLSDRRTNLILSGGVNIYPQEIENELALHPAVFDVAVVGVPDAEMGQQVKAFIQPTNPENAGRELERELIEFCRSRLASFKCPRTIEFVEELPRLPSGKLAKRALMNAHEGQ